MRLLVVTVCVVILHPFPCLSSQGIALINSPDAAISYFFDTQAVSEDFANLETDDRKKLCLDLLANSVTFSDGATDTDNIKTEDFVDKITQTFKETDAKKIFLPSKSFGFDEARFYPGIPVLVCVVEKSDVRWAITKGIHEDIYLLLRKSSDSRTFDMFGLLEPKPTVSSQTELKQLEKKYTDAVKNQRGESVEIVARNKRDDSTLSKLNEYQKLRLCALCYMAFKEAEKEECPKNNRVYLVKDKRNSKILVDAASGEQSEKIYGDLVPCVFDEDSQEPLFSVLSDPSSPFSAFLVKPVLRAAEILKDTSSVSEDEKVIGYQLILHLENVTALKTPSRSF